MGVEESDPGTLEVIFVVRKLFYWIVGCLVTGVVRSAEVSQPGWSG